MSASAVLKLQKVGFTAEQVEALADFMDTQAASKADLEAAAHGLNSRIEELDHKLSSQIEVVEHRTDLKFADIRSEMTLIRADMRAQEQRMIIKLGGMMVVAVGVIVTLVKLLPGGHP